MKLSIIITNYKKSILIPLQFSYLSTVCNFKNRFPFDDSEIIIVDDDSQDNIVEVVKDTVKKYPKFHVRLFETHKSVTHNVCLPMNIGFKRAKGEVVMELPSDTMPRVDFEYILNRHMKDKRMHLLGRCVNPSVLKLKARFLESGASARREHVIKIKGYDESMHGWGGNEPDIKQRLKMIGVKEVPDPKLCFLNFGNLPFHGAQRPYEKRNDELVRLNAQGRKVNPNGWGELDTLEEIKLK